MILSIFSLLICHLYVHVCVSVCIFVCVREMSDKVFGSFFNQVVCFLVEF